MSLKVVPVKIHQLRSQLDEFETEFGMSSPDFVESYSNGELPEEEHRFLTWVLTYDAWRLATDGQ